MPSYTKRSDGRYRTKVYDSSTKKYKYIYATSVQELKKKETELRSQLEKGINVSTADDTFSQWLNRLKEVKEMELTESEYKTFCFRASYFSQKVGNLPLKSINQQLLQPLVNDLLKANPSTGRPSSKRTIQRYISSASAVFEYAIENRSTEYNPCEYLKVPKQAKTEERRALSPAERLWIEETEHRAKPAAMLMMYSGLRRGEATALQWSDINFRNNTITVNKSYDFKGNCIKEPKTKAGTRVVSVPDKLIKYLNTLERKGIYVLTTASGKMMTNDAWHSLWDSYICDLNLKYGTSIVKRNKFDPKGNIITIQPFTTHCLRHTFCTIMYEAGIDVLTAREQMGHSDIKTTLSIYTHLDSQHKKKNISKLNEYLQASTE